ncbi:MAG: hypothetical protein AAGM29_05675, partial [Cyanobacteria bacterium J06588_4]
MSSLSPNRAVALRDAYRICTPEPLVGEDIERYYVMWTYLQCVAPKLFKTSLQIYRYSIQVNVVLCCS